MSTWQRDEAVLWRRSGGRRVLRCPGTDAPIVLEGGGSAAWDLLEHPLTDDELFDVLSEVFGEERSRIEVELSDFLEQLRAAGAVVRR